MLTSQFSKTGKEDRSCTFRKQSRSLYFTTNRACRPDFSEFVVQVNDQISVLVRSKQN